MPQWAETADAGHYLVLGLYKSIILSCRM